jgi:hypothetical protein
VGLPDERLLDVRLCDLDLRLAGTRVERRVKRLYRELERRGLRLRPHAWLSDEWFTPDGVPGIAVPFYLAHPRLIRLERRQLLEAEGESREECMRILRHEAGHALDQAHRIYRRKRYRELFGSAAAPYPKFYQAKPYSRRYVLNLDAWYAQSHPSEDFAETFAVWLQLPRRVWRKRYAGWGALRKLEQLDLWMREIAGSPAPVRSRRVVDPLRGIRRTLRDYYQAKKALYGADHPAFYDRDLRMLFSDAPEHARMPPAAKFLNRIRPEIRRAVAWWTGQFQYTIDQVLVDMVERCRELDLRMHEPEWKVRLEAVTLLTVQTMNYLHSGKHRLVL